MRMHPKISPTLPALLEEGLDGRRSRLGTRRLTAEQRPRRRRAARPNDAVADESRQSPLMLGVKAGSHGFEARDGASSVDDQDRRATPEAIDQRTEVVLGFSNADFLHLTRID